MTLMTQLTLEDCSRRERLEELLQEDLAVCHRRAAQDDLLLLGVLAQCVVHLLDLASESQEHEVASVSLSLSYSLRRLFPLTHSQDAHLFERDAADDKHNDDTRRREAARCASAMATATARAAKAEATEAALEEIDASARQLLRRVDDLSPSSVQSKRSPRMSDALRTTNRKTRRAIKKTQRRTCSSSGIADVVGSTTAPHSCAIRDVSASCAVATSPFDFTDSCAHS